jgi:hypothetical protein
MPKRGWRAAPKGLVEAPHARKHAFGDGHPIVRSFQPGEDWRWCYLDEQFV